MDLDLDDIGIDGPGDPGMAASRPSRFLPKSSKLKPKPKEEPVSSEPEPQPCTPLPKKQEDSSMPSLDATVKSASEPSPSSTLNNFTKVEKTEEQVVEDAMEVDGDEDAVVREIDVFFTPPPLDNNTQLYVLQYPLRPCWRPYELDERCEQVRVKPKSSQMEVDLSLNVDDRSSYNDDAPAQMRTKMQTLSTSWKPPATSGYAVGLLMGNKLHLNPVHAVVQLRPSMEHLKSGGPKKNNIVEANIKFNEKKEESAGPSKKQGKLARASDKQNTDDAESWVSLEYHGRDSSFSSRYRQKMAAEESYLIPFSMSPYDFVNSLCPGTTTDSNRAKGPSRRLLLSLPLEERFKTYLSEGPEVHRFTALKHLAPDESDEDVLLVLQKHAYLVQGLWVTASSLLCEGIKCLARDYILLLFSKNPLISYKQQDASGLSKEVLRRMLKPLAVERPSFKNWKFKEPMDMSFIKGHPNAVREQERLWEKREKNIMVHVTGAGKGGPAMRNSFKSTMTNRPGASSSDQGAKRSVDGAVRSETVSMSDETREALPRALVEVFRIHKVCSLQLIREGLRDLALSKSNLPKADPRAAIAAAKGADAHLPELQTVISQIAVNIHGVYVLKSSPDHSDSNPLRFASDLSPPLSPPPPKKKKKKKKKRELPFAFMLKSGFSLCRSVIIKLFCAKEPNATLKKADVVHAAKIDLKRDIKDSEFSKVISELCIARGNAWCMKSGDGKPR
ncbi:DNA-directed RNA polymerase III subunit RPC5 isoform X2 [Telopea speciosissima]|uniref:DNA-directed RNA polymerase III subunit RPC5 isoform X2 n=1 Tax=Telopea speciosissima TaxID=54955 RepID=UPI001CC5B405|nr:DNA-directed RNA polymerase III subunit RPC5 isoform X2 [Telopea speciosissima]